MRTNIIATLGPATLEYEIMRAMVEEGVRIFRLNFSHADAEFFKPVIEKIRTIEHDMGFPLTAMADLCGPKIRIGEVPDSPVEIHKDQEIELGLPDKCKQDVAARLAVPELLVGAEVGDPVYLSDGMLRFQITKVLEKDTHFLMRAQTSGLLTSNKGIAFPDKIHPMPALTPKDVTDLGEALDVGIDAVALSFVQTAQDIQDAKDIISRKGTWVPVIAKLERKRALENMDDIVRIADGIMVARGDLGVECSMASLPVIQKCVIRACRQAQKPCIIATQMMLSMVNNPMPTRAEANDVGNAIMDGADCVMLSEETAIGSYPIETCAQIKDIAREAETYFLERLQGPHRPTGEKNLIKQMAYSACLIAAHDESQGIITHSAGGTTARMLSSRRPAQLVYALTADGSILHWLNFFWGLRPSFVPSSTANHMDRAILFAKNSFEFRPGKSIVITSGQPDSPGQTDVKTNTIKLFNK